MKIIRLSVICAATIFSLCTCKKESNDPRDKILGTYRLAGIDSLVEPSFQTGVPPYVSYETDSGTLRISKVSSPDSAGWIRISGLGADAGDYLNFDINGATDVDALYSDSSISIQYMEFHHALSGTAVFAGGKLTITYSSWYIPDTKYGVISSY